MSTNWYLEESIDDGALQRVEIAHFPFRIGRAPDLDLRIRSAGVSRLHAELTQVGDRLLVRDLESSNGTFVNRQRVAGVAPLRMGDVLHVGSVELRLRREEVEESDLDVTQLLEGELSRRLPTGTRQFYELLATGAVTASLQPIVEAGSRRLHGQELLGRGAHDSLPQDPAGLFALAESLGMAAELSELFRRRGLEALAGGAAASKIFLNTHPHELLAEDRLFADLRRLRGAHPQAPLVLEIHERAVVDAEAMARLGGLLEELGIGLAYDDFGAGQARFKELVRCPPDYIKFDASMILGLAAAPEARASLITLLLELTRDLDILTIAEGIESEADARACADAGFDLLQGFHVGAPVRRVTQRSREAPKPR